MQACCGIPDLEMIGQETDWKLLVDKFKKLEELIAPIKTILNQKNGLKKHAKHLKTF